jgi:serine/threonine protein kinase
MDSLYEDFTNDLLETSKTLFHELPLDSWNPQEVAAPERHISLRKDPLPQCVALLDQLNPAFARVEQMMRVYFSPTSELSLDAEKEQVWLFGYSWFSAYYDMLMEGSILLSEFYRKYHDLLFELLRKCLQVDPVDRPTFASLLKLWPGTCKSTSLREVSLVSISSSTFLSSASLSSASLSSASLSSASLSSSLVAVPVVSASVAASPPQSSSKRLVLLGHGGRKKTRRNPRS